MLLHILFALSFVLSPFRPLAQSYALTSSGKHACSSGQSDTTSLPDSISPPADSARQRWARSIPAQLHRTQFPQPPYHYTVEDITYSSALTGLRYGATLTKPIGAEPFPTVILIDGTGPQDRDYTAFGHKYFWTLAHYLSNHGIAVLRIDDRGEGITTGDYNKATTLDFAKDMAAALTYLQTRKDIDVHNIGLIGHSEGGIIAPMVYAMHPEAIRFLILLSPPVIGLRAINRFQTRLSYAHSWPDDINNTGIGRDSLVAAQSRLQQAIVDQIPAQAHNQKELKQLLARSLEDFCKRENPEILYKLSLHNDESSLYTLMLSYQGFLSPWWQFILTYDPLTDIHKIHCPLLALFGDKDMQVPPVEDYQLLKENLPDTDSVELLPGLNHFMQPDPSPTPPTYYGHIETTIAPVVLSRMTDWINQLPKITANTRSTM